MIAIALAYTVWRAFVGTPPVRSRPRLALLVAPVAIAGYVVAVLLLARGDEDLAGIGLAVGVEAAALGAWLARGPSGGDDDGGGGGEGPDDGGWGPPDEPPRPGGPVDWDAFDRARAGWRPPAGVR